MSVRVYTNSMSSAASLCTFDVGGSHDEMYLVVPTFTSITALKIEAAVTSAATYYQLFQVAPATTTVQCWPFVIAATLTSGGGVVPLPPSTLQYFRVHTVDSNPTAAVNFSVICSNSNTL